MNVSVKWTGNLSFKGVSGRTNAEVLMDTSVENGGLGNGASPMELVLMGLAGCSGIDAVSILGKKRIAFDGLEILVQGERASDHPKVFNKINVVYRFSGSDLESKLKALEDSIRLSMEKYCSVAGMLEHTAEITWQIEIEKN